FPEVESVVGKAGRADTPTDPAPLDMVETFVNFRPRELWPKRVLRYDDAVRQTRATLALLEARGYVVRIAPEHPDDRASLVADATQKALERFDEIMRELSLRRYVEFEDELGRTLTRFAVDEISRRVARTRRLHWPPGADPDRVAADIAAALAPDFGPALAKNP